MADQLVKSTRARWGLRMVAVVYVLALVAVPVGLVFWRTIEQGWSAFTETLTAADSVHAYQLTAVVAGSAVVINTVFGVGMALLLARFRFRGKRILNVLIDLPVSVSPIVVGLALVLVFGFRTGWFGPDLRSAGLQIIFATPGMILATTFVALPLVVREVLPVLEETGVEQEEAARSLGANGWQRFVRITLPTIKWALAYGIVLGIARSIGEFGAVKVVSGNVTGRTQTVTLLVDQHAEQLETGAYQLAVVLILVAALAIQAISFLRPKEGA
ncbi:sulfate ABC transporter permease subunit [Jatrophihabitans telluris]|uniref:Sulfate ABC transporter permease subunit n=1 Tax=Jatrophihabitans telluris TaxID=2038343 RepID=A0ABY4QSD4_9ACTN|nr:sulfate ABC transporter permease subunit [Jatrophihabitans telluris]UQX86771.1 sulfate ABC transporter permease subunit [Jatrophihabitans telluris]